MGETTPELDMSLAREAYENMPSREHNMDRIEYMEGLDTETLRAIEKKGLKEDDMYNIMDSVAAGIELESRDE